MSAPTTRTTTLTEAIDHIAAEPDVWVRIAAVRHEDGTWHERLLELTSGAAPPSWEPREWEYQSALFAALVERGETVGEWLRACNIHLGDREIALPEMTTSVTWERRQSRSAAPYEALDWPATEATVSRVAGSQDEPQGHLVSGGDAPSFINFYTAAACFFWIDREPVGGSLQQGVMYRHQDTRGRINGVRIADDGVEVEVEGSAIDGMIVELAGEAPGTRQRIWDRNRARPEAVKFSLEHGLPSGAWVLMRSGAEWIDRRFLTVPWTRGREAGVEVVVEPRTKLEALLANREGPQVEFKRQVPTDDDGKAKVMKTVCAFANGQGGSILFGIDDDHYLVGVAGQGIDRVKDQLTQTVDSWVDSRLSIDFKIMPIGDGAKVVLELSVEPGTRLYGCARPGEVPTPYVRHYATTVKARLSEIEEIVRSRTPGNPLSAW